VIVEFTFVEVSLPTVVILKLSNNCVAYKILFSLVCLTINVNLPLDLLSKMCYMNLLRFRHKKLKPTLFVCFRVPTVANIKLDKKINNLS